MPLRDFLVLLWSTSGTTTDRQLATQQELMDGLFEALDVNGEVFEQPRVKTAGNSRQSCASGLVAGPECLQRNPCEQGALSQLRQSANDGNEEFAQDRGDVIVIKNGQPEKRSGRKIGVFYGT